MNLIIDIGNTRIKLAVFKQFSLIEKKVVPRKELYKSLKIVFDNYKIAKAIVASVSFFDEIEFAKWMQKVPFINLNHTINLPFKNQYKSPETLGVDRLAVAAAAVHQYPNKNVLVIDAGTCITYDFISSNKVYLGGAIAPGIAMRYESLHNYTEKLPLLTPRILKKLIGETTSESIQIGIINGLSSEINDNISRYFEKFNNLTVVLTGGDTYFLSKIIKSSIFANPNFLLDGLNSILMHNLK